MPGFETPQQTPKSAQPDPAIAIDLVREDQSGDTRHFVQEIDDFDLPSFVSVAAAFGQQRFGYVVTPNADHLLRLRESPGFRSYYARASFVLLDSRLISTLLRATRGIRLPVCTGSDLTRELLTHIAHPADRILLVGGSAEQAKQIAAAYGLRNLSHHAPPMGFIHDPEATERCLEFIEGAGPFRFCFIALGSPQQEIVAHRLAQRERARGLALCIGASLNFLTGAERRAPMWMQRLSLEWLFRLVTNPRRLGHRYLVRGPRLLMQLPQTQLVLRSKAPALR
jgi:exopolysaccharide biosynthesis WecB/TagA/CpsF family protein